MDVEVFRGSSGFDAQISECFNKGKIILHGNDKWCRIGGITSMCKYISACYNLGTVSLKGSSDVIGNCGGIVGAVSKGELESCYNVGDISCEQGANSNRRVGDIAGCLDSADIQCTNCWYIGTTAVGFKRSDSVGIPNKISEDISLVNKLGTRFKNNPSGQYPVLWWE